jgi:hypothetical protein
MTASSFNSRPFKDMTRKEKARFIAQLIAFICTFGFAYGTLLHSDEYVATYR